MAAETKTDRYSSSQSAVSAVRKATMSDWLTLLEVSSVKIEGCLKNARQQSIDSDDAQLGNLSKSVETPSVALKLVSSALRAKFPEVAGSIETAQGGVSSTGYDVSTVH